MEKYQRHKQRDQNAGAKGKTTEPRSTACRAPTGTLYDFGVIFHRFPLP
jgi:hypothetical protein